ncbi:MAG: DUF5683 domain-containing protein [Prevotellaceae bacterium]|jgi:hypothetical protein|nr:DUF5683 domain-containing protein [Prevotellaceae bacterium]
MTQARHTYHVRITLLLCFLLTAGITIYGQETTRRDSVVRQDDVRRDSASIDYPAPIPVDSLQQALNPLPRWTPNPNTATWLALVIPGGGQIYNRKYWKLPIIYGGFAGCAYALTWNGNMYRDYANAYKDAANDHWTSSNIIDLLPPGYTDRVSHQQITDILRRRKDMYRRYRDMSIFAFIAVYLISVVDAYVDAELSNFDLSPDLSMHIEPTVIDNRNQPGAVRTPDRHIGMQCSFRF